MLTEKLASLSLKHHFYFALKTNHSSFPPSAVISRQELVLFTLAHWEAGAIFR